MICCMGKEIGFVCTLHLGSLVCFQGETTYHFQLMMCIVQVGNKLGAKLQLHVYYSIGLRLEIASSFYVGAHDP